MASRQSAAADYERRPRDNRLSMDDWAAVAHLADWPLPRFAA
ncbi:hypothetical protein [Pseudofrankia sp. BMG5.37]|nr:hypothetical protein [Pseudofrankia sp. BMG5.37]MDT3440730.1 hypothetical protein [Pseudofrankia sp. BMG5.37]